MANNYLEFSEMLETVNKEEREWLEDQLEDVVEEGGKLHLEGEAPEAEEETWRGPRFLHAHKKDFPVDVDLDFSWELVAGGLWLYTEESGNPGTVALLVQAYFRKFDPKGIWHLSWAETCSKPRLSQFGGGAVVVTANDQHWMSTYTFQSEKISDLCDKEGLKEHVSNQD